MNLLEAFKQLDSLNEETFSVDADGIKKLSAFTQSDDSGDELDVFDLDAMDDEEAIDACHLNDVILDCCVCHSKIFAPADKLVVDEETGVANAGEECPYCYSVDGYKVIGQVAPIEDAEVRADSEDDEDDVNESLKESKVKYFIEDNGGGYVYVGRDNETYTDDFEVGLDLENYSPEFDPELVEILLSTSSPLEKYKQLADNNYFIATDDEYINKVPNRFKIELVNAIIKKANEIEFFESEEDVNESLKESKEYYAQNFIANQEFVWENIESFEDYEDELANWEKYPQLIKDNNLVIPEGTKLIYKGHDNYYLYYKLPEYRGVTVYFSGDTFESDFSKYLTPVNDNKNSRIPKMYGLKTPDGSRTAVVDGYEDGLYIVGTTATEWVKTGRQVLFKDEASALKVSKAMENDHRGEYRAERFYFGFVPYPVSDSFVDRYEWKEVESNYGKVYLSERGRNRFNKVNESLKRNRRKLIKESKELSTVEGTLGNVLDAHKNELSRLTTAKEIGEFLETIKPEIKKDQQAFVDTVIEKVKRLPDMKALQYVYNIILKGDNLSTKLDANKKRLTASVEDDYYVGDEDGGRIYHGCEAAKKAAKKLADSGVKVIMHKVENELEESLNESVNSDIVSMIKKQFPKATIKTSVRKHSDVHKSNPDTPVGKTKYVDIRITPDSAASVNSILQYCNHNIKKVLDSDSRFDYYGDVPARNPRGGEEVILSYQDYSGLSDDEYNSLLGESLKESTYNDYGGIMGEPGEQYTDADLKSYWDSNNSSDPVLNAYKGNYDAWLKDTISNMHRVNEAIMKRLEAYVSNINEAEMSDEDKHDSELIRSMIDKMQARSNAAFTPEEQAIMQKYNINRNNTSRNLTVDGRDLAREVDTNQNYYSSKNNGNPEKINYADRARKLSQRKDNQIFNQPYSADNDDINVHGYKRVAFSDLQDAERYNQNVQMQEPVNTMKNELRNRSYAQNRIDNAEKNRADRMAKAQAAFDKAKAEADRNYNYDTEYSAKERDIAQANIDKLLKRGTNESLEASEVIEPVSDEVKNQIELDVDEFDDESFDKLTESFLKQNYSNIDSYKTKNVTSKGNKFFVEGIIKFESGKERKTSFLFEAVKASRNNKIRLIGENINFAKDHKSLSLVGSVDSKQLISESLAYNYKQKDESGKIKTIRGSVKSK